MSKKFGAPPGKGVPIHLRYPETLSNWGTIVKPQTEYQQKLALGRILLPKGHLEARTKLDVTLHALCESVSWACVYCDRELTTRNATLDHVVPISRGGSKTDRGNMVACCAACNNEKGDRILDVEWVPPNMRVIPVDLPSFRVPQTGRFSVGRN